MNPHFITRRACPVCDCVSSTLLFSRPYTDNVLRTRLEAFYAAVGQLDYDALLGADYVVLKCASCALVYQRDIPDDFLLAKLYEEWISPEKAFTRFHAHLSRSRERELLHGVQLSLALQPTPAAEARALDYGCGWGEWANTIRKFGIESWGTELSPTRGAACLRTGITIVSDAELPKEGFDLINADQVFEHLPAPANTLRFLRTKLRSTGVIRIAVPNGWRVPSALKHFDRELSRSRLGALNPIAPLEHLNCFTTASLLRLAAECGLLRVRPSYRTSLRSAVWPAGGRAKLKQILLPLYLHSGWTTQLWFTPTTALRR